MNEPAPSGTASGWAEQRANGRPAVALPVAVASCRRRRPAPAWHAPQPQGGVGRRGQRAGAECCRRQPSGSSRSAPMPPTKPPRAVARQIHKVARRSSGAGSQAAATSQSRISERDIVEMGQHQQRRRRAQAAPRASAAPRSGRTAMIASSSRRSAGDRPRRARGAGPAPAHGAGDQRQERGRPRRAPDAGGRPGTAPLPTANRATLAAEIAPGEDRDPQRRGQRSRPAAPPPAPPRPPISVGVRSRAGETTPSRAIAAPAAAAAALANGPIMPRHERASQAQAIVSSRPSR